MNNKEIQIQQALGLFKKYSGYVQAQGSTHYDIYEVRDVTMEGAIKQLYRIMSIAQKDFKAPLELAFIVDETKDK